MLEALGGNTALMRHVMSTCAVIAKVQAVEKALATGDAAEMRKQAHTLKGTLNYVYATRAADAAKRLELLCATLDSIETNASDSAKALAACIHVADVSLGDVWSEARRACARGGPRPRQRSSGTTA